MLCHAVVNGEPWLISFNRGCKIKLLFETPSIWVAVCIHLEIMCVQITGRKSRSILGSSSFLTVITLSLNDQKTSLMRLKIACLLQAVPSSCQKSRMSNWIRKITLEISDKIMSLIYTGVFQCKVTPRAFWSSVLFR